MPAQLVALDIGPSILLDKPILLLGRHPECDIQINSRKISRRHCCIAQVSDYLVVRDLGSTNGIRINGIRIVEGRLSAGDELTIGNHRYKVSWDAAVAAAGPGPASPQSPSPPGKAADAFRKPAVDKPSPLAAIEDEMLESSDEPVPLDEPGVKATPPAQPIAAPPSPKPSSPSPEKRDLMPNSRLFPEDASPPPSSIHPPA